MPAQERREDVIAHCLEKGIDDDRCDGLEVSFVFQEQTRSGRMAGVIVRESRLFKGPT